MNLSKKLLGLVSLAKKQAIDHIRKTTGMLIDSPTSAGGNTNTGVLAENFLHPQHRDTICSMIKKCR